MVAAQYGSHNDAWFNHVRASVWAEAVNRHVKGDQHGNLQEIFEELFEDPQTLAERQNIFVEDRTEEADIREVKLREQLLIALQYGWNNRYRVLTGKDEDAMPIIHHGALTQVFEVLAHHSQLYYELDYQNHGNLAQIINWWIQNQIDAVREHSLIRGLGSLPLEFGSSTLFSNYLLSDGAHEQPLLKEGAITPNFKKTVLELASKQLDLTDELLTTISEQELIRIALEQLLSDEPIFNLFLPLAFVKEQSLMQLLFEITQKLQK
jgi:hypothetical protein